MKYCIDIYVSYPKRWMKKYNFKVINGRYGTYYSIKADKKAKNKIIRKLIWSNVKYKCYEECWSRSSDYRKMFFKHNKPPYRCRYCNRSLERKKLFVDHIIPVHQAKVNKTARFLLKIRKINDVNDVRNLVPSCRRCNDLKNDKMGVWLIRAWLGKYKLYWIFKPIVVIAFILFVIYGLESHLFAKELTELMDIILR